MEEVIIVNFDVVARPGDELGSRVPDPQGIRLWSMFREQNLGRVGLVVNYDHDMKRDILETWLKKEGIKASFYDAVGTNKDIKREKILQLLSLHGRAEMYVDTDVELCTALIKDGVPCLIYANPTIIRPEWHDMAPKRTSWEELSAELDRQALLKAERDWKE